MHSFKIKTPQNEVIIDYFFEFISKEQVPVNRVLFEEMCKKGCKNYNNKYSCPPFTPKFEYLIKNREGLFIILFSSPLSNIKSSEYNKVRIANSVMKSRMLKLMYYLESKFNTQFLSSGSCNLCKPCKCKLKLPCKHPDKRRYSLESIGIDCNKLSKDLFNHPLTWYKNKKAPEYSCIICGLICNQSQIQEIEKEIINYQFG
jgi:predicted metal-binding protein